MSEKIEKAMAKVEAMREELRDAQAGFYLANDELVGAVAESLGLEGVVIELSGQWECPPTDDPYWKPEYATGTSPTGFCVYNDDKDPAHDNCLFCGWPEERK